MLMLWATVIVSSSNSFVRLWTDALSWERSERRTTKSLNTVREFSLKDINQKPHTLDAFFLCIQFSQKVPTIPASFLFNFLWDFEIFYVIRKMRHNYTQRFKAYQSDSDGTWSAGADLGWEQSRLGKPSPIESTIFRSCQKCTSDTT